MSVAHGFDFKIKVTEETLGINKIEFDSKFTCERYLYDLATEEFEFRGNYEIENYVGNLMFVINSQGVTINSIPFSSNHYYKGESSKYCNFDFLSSDTLLIESYNREYLNGVDIEELIDRHTKTILGNRYRITREEISNLKFKFWFIRIYEISYSVEYISEGVRFKIYYSKGDEDLLYVNQNIWKDDNSAANHLLTVALSNGLITDAEYHIEINRLKNLETKKYDKLLDGIKLILSLPVNFEIPNGDDYYNYVSDLRTGDEERKLVFKFGKD